MCAAALPHKGGSEESRRVQVTRGAAVCSLAVVGGSLAGVSRPLLWTPWACGGASGARTACERRANGVRTARMWRVCAPCATRQEGRPPPCGHGAQVIGRCENDGYDQGHEYTGHKRHQAADTHARSPPRRQRAPPDRRDV